MQKNYGVSKEEVVLALEAKNNIDSLESATYESTKDGNTVTLLDKLSTGKDEQEQITNRLTVKSLIDSLEEREKKVIMLRFYKEQTQSQVAKVLGITQVQVSRIEKKILNNMKEKLTS